MATIEISARKREAQGTGASRRLRNAGKVPGVLYGGEKGAVNIVLDHQALFLNLRNERFHASILTMDLDGAKEQVLLRALNMHPFKLQVQHVDFQRVSKDKKVHMKVPLHFANAEKSPGVKEQGGLVSHVLNELNISCLPDDLPEFIEVDLQTLEIGAAVHLADLKIPKGVESVQLTRGDNAVVATVQIPRAMVEVEPTVAAEAVEGAAAEGAAAPVAGAAPAAGADVKKEAEKKKEPEKKEGGKK